MQPCVTLMLGFDSNVKLAWDAAVVTGENIGWIANNSSKPGRSNNNCFVVHSSNDWAKKNINQPDDYITDSMLSTLTRLMGEEFNDYKHIGLHKWRYANIASLNGQTFHLDLENKIAACGDWCIKGRVEAAFLSSMHLTDSLMVM